MDSLTRPPVISVRPPFFHRIAAAARGPHHEKHATCHPSIHVECSVTFAVSNTNNTAVAIMLPPVVAKLDSLVH
eukprot:scaffold244038_cov34-Attheya_sp.AAC.2